MKVHVEIDCTPEEARRAVGLPDLTPVHDRFVATMIEAMSGGIPREMMETMTRQWGPMNDAGMAVWRRMFETAARSGD